MSHRTLVVHSGGIGDFICTLPALEWLSRDTEITIAGIPERAALAQLAGIAAAVHALDAIGFHTVFSEPNDILRTSCSTFDAALVWMADEDHTIQRSLQQAGIPSVRCFPGVPESGWSQSAALWYGSRIGANVTLPYTLPLPIPVERAGVVIHPGSGSARKNWPMTAFIDVANALAREGHTVYWCLGPAEGNLALPGERLPAVSLIELATVLSGARLYIGNDSGIGHLAAITGCPTLSLFGPTDPVVWRPIGPLVHVMHGDPWPDVRTVYTEAEAVLGVSDTGNFH